MSIFFSENLSDEEIVKKAEKETVKKLRKYNCEECLTSMGPNNQPLTWCQYYGNTDYYVDGTIFYTCLFANKQLNSTTLQYFYCGAEEGDIANNECPS